MIVNTGALKLLNAQLTYLGTLYWSLFTNNLAILSTTQWTDLTEASFPGYSRVLAGGFSAAAQVGTRASTSPATPPVFTNGGGSNTVVYGWALIDATGPTVIAAVNTGPTTIPAGLSLTLSGVVTDKDEAA